MASSGRRRFAAIGFVLFGVAVASYLGAAGPKEQHVRIVLGSAAPDVASLDLRYVGSDGDLLREARFAYQPGAAPRIVSHEPKLPNGDYRLEIDVEGREGRRGLQRQVTLGGGSTQVDISSVFVREERFRDTD